MKLWAGRFQKQTDELVNDFNASISFDQRLYKQDITGSMAHAQMLCDCGILTAQDNEKIQAGARRSFWRRSRRATVDVYRRQRGYPHERRDAADRENRRRRQAPAYGKKPERSGRARFPAVPARGNFQRDRKASAVGERSCAKRRRRIPEDRHARLYAFAKGAADYLCPASAWPTPACLRATSQDWKTAGPA